MSDPLKNTATLFYVYDPMCSWCWGYRPTWLALQQALQNELPELEVRYLLGGLAADSEQPMALQMQQFLENTWHQIAQQLNTQFNFDFWRKNKPRRSTYPACRACLLARALNKESEMLFAIQQAYYLQAKNPSNETTLIQLAKQIGLNENTFSEQLSNPLTQQKLINEINKTHSLPIQGFPSLVININGQDHSVPIDYQQWKNTFKIIKEILNNK